MSAFCSDLITMVPEWSRPPGTVNKNSINTKMTISQDPLVEIDPTLCQNVSCIKPLYFFQFGIPKWLPFANTKNSAEHENDNISITT